jgi:putative ABC transport system permease protein
MNFHYVLSELRHRHHRTLVNVLGIAIGIALFVSINAVSAAYKKAVSAPFQNLGADLVVQKPEKRDYGAARMPLSMKGIKVPFSNQVLSTGDVQRLGSLDGVSRAASSLLLWEFDPSGFRTIMGVDLSQPSLGPVKVKEWLKEGRFPARSGEAIFEKHYAKFHRTKLGDLVTIGERRFTVVGLLEIKEGSQIASANIYVPLVDAQELAGGVSGANLVYLRLKDPSLLSHVKSQIGRLMPAASVTSSDSFLELMGGVSKISDQFSWLVSAVALGGAIFLIIKTMLANLVARSNEIGILKAVGWTERNVQKQLLTEALLQSFTGGVAGVFAGYVISYSLGFLSIPVSTPWQINLTPALARDAVTAVTTAVRLPVSVSASLTAVSLGLSLVAGVLGSLFMGRRTSRMKPVDILRKL